MANRIRIHFMDGGRGECDSSGLGFVGVAGTWSWQQLISTVNLAGMLFLYRLSHRVSCINVCALLYCPATPPPPNQTANPTTQPPICAPTILQHLVTFYLFFAAADDTR